RVQAWTQDAVTALTGYKQEKNTIVKATLRRILSWLLDKPVPLTESMKEECQRAVAETHEIQRADAEDILDLKTDRRVVFLYHRAVMQDDWLWSSVVGGIYLLSAIRDLASRAPMLKKIARSQHKEIRIAA